MTKRKMLAIVLVAVGALLVLAACQTATPTPCPECPKAPACPTAVPCPTVKPAVEAPFQKLWAASGHADVKAEAFVHWDTATPKEIPAGCANCHSSTGFQEFAATGKVAKNVPTGTTVDCAACHSEAALALTSVTFPSGVKISNLGPEARCMSCHDGRASKKTIDDLIAKFKPADPDKPVDPLKNADGTTSNFSLQTAHYFTAALSLYGTEVKGGYEYAGKEYDAKFMHIDGYETCVDCHNPHSLELELTACKVCHTDVKVKEDLKKIRMVSSSKDFNGNGDVKEGVAAEVAGVQATLLKAITAYAKDVIGTGIVYDNATYPYWFQDKENDGKADKDDKGAAVSYTKVTPRLLQAAFNYVVVAKDPGVYAHNAKYAIELMYDSIADLNTKLPTKIDMSKMVREDVGHFSGAGMPFRDWDDTMVVPMGCAKCHSATGLPQFMANAGKVLVTATGLETTGITPQPSSNGFSCYTCHDEAKWPAVYSVTAVPFPNGKSLTFSTKKDDKGNLLPVGANLCIECHQGRQSTATVNNALAAYPDLDKVEPKLSLPNVHYFAAGATLFGGDADGIYEYAGKTYTGQFAHTAGFTTCTDCHDKHTLEIKVAACTACHPTAKTLADVETIRITKDDYSGSKVADEPMAKVVETFQKRLLAAIQKYAKDKVGAGIVYNPDSRPYFFMDKDNDGKIDKDDKGANVGFTFTARLVKAGYNYHYSVKDPGAFAHNAKYVLQALYDSIQDLGGDVTGLTRPVPPAK